MRSSKQEKQYRKHQKHTDSTVCSFCVINEDHAQFVHGTKFFKIIRNRFPYDFWDGQGIVDHLMIVPHRHTHDLSSMKNDEKIEYVDLIATYEGRGYSFFARSPSSITKSIAHQHTHLIKSDRRLKRFVLLLKKPLIRILR
jgi:hypothetical protein